VNYDPKTFYKIKPNSILIDKVCFAIVYIITCIYLLQVAKLVREPSPDMSKLLTIVKRHYEEINKMVYPPHHAITMAENKLYHVLVPML
jgi:hypothetical protein